MDLVNRTIQHLQNRRDKLINGGINSIPSPFKRFRSEFIGIEQGKYYVCTATTKGGKTQFTSFMFLYTPLLYAYTFPEQLKVTVFYYPLEETPEDITRRFMSFLLNKLSNNKIRISPTDLLSSSNDKPLPQDIINLLQDDQYAKVLKFFEDNVHFSTSRNPTGVYNEVKRYMEENGTVYKRKQKVKNDFGDTVEIDAFDYYVPNNPNEYVIIILDHASLIQPERGMSLKQTVDKLSEYFVILRNRYNVSPVLVQQQSFELENLDAFKEKRLRPTAQGLSDSKYTARDCNILVGLFSPFKFEIPEYKGYDITVFRDNIRFIEVILNRGGSAGGLLGTFFDGATCDFIELPLPAQKSDLNKVYTYLQQLRHPQKSVSMFLFKIKNSIKSLFN